MRRTSILAAGLLLIAAAGTASAQAAGAGAPPPADTAKPTEAAPALSIEGSWSGYLDMGGNSQPMNAMIKKEGDAFTGTITGMQGDVALQQIELKGDMLTMMAAMPAPNGGGIEVWYSFKVSKDTLSGQLDANFNGQAFSLPLTLKRVP